MASKKATNIDEQIALLRSRGMSIDDEGKSKEILLDIGYYRLGFYCFPFEKSYPQKQNRTHEYRDETKFIEVVDLYYFDLRSILLNIYPELRLILEHMLHILFQIIFRIQKLGLLMKMLLTINT